MRFCVCACVVCVRLCVCNGVWDEIDEEMTERESDEFQGYRAIENCGEAGMI